MGTKAGRRELGLPAPSAKTQKYAMIAMERANEAPKLLQLIQSIESPDSAIWHWSQSMHWTRNARRSQRLGCAGPGKRAGVTCIRCTSFEQHARAGSRGS